MFADVTQCHRAKHGIHQGMKRHVCVGVPQQAQMVGDGHTAEDKIPAFYQTVHVVALTDAQGREVMGQESFGHFDVLRCGEFDVAAVTKGQVDRYANALHKGGIIRTEEFLGLCGLMGTADQLYREALGCLY